jgi:hypothetical protein
MALFGGQVRGSGLSRTSGFKVWGTLSLGFKNRVCLIEHLWAVRERAKLSNPVLIHSIIDHQHLIRAKALL